jgi:Sulfotransferase domain
MPIPKNRLTTSPFARIVRRVWRHRVRPLWQDTVASSRTRRRPFRGNPPAYLIIGANKAGTTALFQSLAVRTSFGTPLLKEVHYFDLFPDRSATWYFSHFWGPGDLIWGEATPEYLDLPEAPERVKTLLPDVQLIVCLRDPVARAISHYHNGVDHGTEKRPLRTAVAEELRSLEQGKVPASPEELERAYVWRSRYSTSIERWIRVFGLAGMLFLVAERREESVARVLDFLGQRDSGYRRTVTSNARRYPPAPSAVIEAIAEAVRPDVDRLPSLLGWSALPPEWML